MAFSLSTYKRCKLIIILIPLLNDIQINKFVILLSQLSTPQAFDQSQTKLSPHARFNISIMIPNV